MMERLKSRKLLYLAILVLGINVNSFAADHASAASAGGGTSLIARLSDWWVSLGPDGSLKSAIEANNLAGVQQALRLGANPNAYLEEDFLKGFTNSQISDPAEWIVLNETILSRCIRLHANLQIITVLLAAGADIAKPVFYKLKMCAGESAQTYYVYGPIQSTDLFSAISVIDEPILEVLTRHITTTTVRNQALLMACRLGYTKIVTQLISAGANINYAQYWPCFLSKGRQFSTIVTPLALAVKHDQIAVVKMLLAAGVQVNQPLTQGYGIVALAKSSTMLNLLIAADANINAKSSLNSSNFYRPNKNELIKILIAAGAILTTNAFYAHSFINRAYHEVIVNNRKLQRSLVTENLKAIMQAIHAGVWPEGMQTALQKLVTEIKADALYEIIDGLILNKINLKIKDEVNCTLLDSAILANNYKAVDALLLHGFNSSDLHPDSIPNLLATMLDLALDQYGNVMFGDQKIGEICNWSKVIDSSVTQICLPNLRVVNLNQELCGRIGIDETQVLEFAKSHLILKLLQDSEMAHSSLAMIAADGGATGFMTGSVPIRYTTVKSGEILETLRMQLAERDSLMAGLQSIAVPVRTVKIDSEFGIEMVPMHGGMERYANQAAGRHPLENANGGWTESKDSE